MAVGLTEYEAVTEMSRGVLRLIELEKALAKTHSSGPLKALACQ